MHQQNETDRVDKLLCHPYQVAMFLNQNVETIVNSRTCDIEIDELGFQNFHLTANVQRNIEEQRIVTFTERKHIEIHFTYIIIVTKCVIAHKKNFRFPFIVV